MTVFKVYCGKLAVKLYTKAERVLRVEAMAINTRELRCGRTIERFSQTVNALKGILERFLEVLLCMDRCFVTTQTLDRLSMPSRLGKTQIGGIEMNRPRLRRVAKALLSFGPIRSEFTVSDLLRHVHSQFESAKTQYGPRQAAYDLKKFCAKGLVTRNAGGRRYRVVSQGLRIISGLLILRDGVLDPLLSAVEHPLPETRSSETHPLDGLYRQLRGTMSQLLDRLGFSAHYLQNFRNATPITA